MTKDEVSRANDLLGTLEFLNRDLQDWETCTEMSLTSPISRLSLKSQSPPSADGAAFASIRNSVKALLTARIAVAISELSGLGVDVG